MPTPEENNPSASSDSSQGPHLGQASSPEALSYFLQSLQGIQSGTSEATTQKAIDSLLQTSANQQKRIEEQQK